MDVSAPLPGHLAPPRSEGKKRRTMSPWRHASCHVSVVRMQASYPLLTASSRSERVRSRFCPMGVIARQQRCVRRGERREGGRERRTCGQYSWKNLPFASRPTPRAPSSCADATSAMGCEPAVERQ